MLANNLLNEDSSEETESSTPKWRTKLTKQMSQEESRKQFHASCLDANCPLQVSAPALYGLLKLQPQCEHLLEYLLWGANQPAEWATYRQCGNCQCSGGDTARLVEAQVSDKTSLHTNTDGAVTDRTMLTRHSGYGLAARCSGVSQV